MLKTKRHFFDTRRMVEGALMVALATVLSLCKLVEMPYGGSVTVAGMLPIILMAYRNGTRWGLTSGLVYAVIQQLLGLRHVSQVTGWQSVVGLILLDYLLAFTVAGLGGVFRGRIRRQPVALTAGAVLACVLRYLCHVVAGATVWAGISIPTAAALIYSFSYNATYMLPELLVTAAAAYYLGSVLDFTAHRVTRRTAPAATDTLAKWRVALRWIAAVYALAVLVLDVGMLAGVLQDPQTGWFTLARLGDAPWLLIGVLSGSALLLLTLALLLGRRSHRAD